MHILRAVECVVYGQLGSYAMTAMLKKAFRKVCSWIEALEDALPRYNYYEGPLHGKVMWSNGKAYIEIESDAVEVDRETFDTLVIGEDLRIRYTRRKKAINIDRIMYK